MLIHLGLIDLLVLAASILAAIAIGLRLSGKTKTAEAFLVGDRNLPWWAILGSIVATETSTATVLSLPGEAYGPTGLKWLQLAMGYIVGRSIVVVYLLPLFFEGTLLSAYQVLGRRFGGRIKMLASLLFLITRNLGDGLRLFLAALVLRELVGWPFWSSAVAIGGITMLYTYFGGMRSVVWNDCIQLVIYMAGGIATIFIVIANIPGGWTEFWQFASANEKLTVVQALPPGSTTSTVRWLLTDPFSLWAGLIGGAVLTLGTHGTDQMMVQRYLSARSQQDAGRALLASGVFVFFQFALFLFVGLLLACFYDQQKDVEFARADAVYAHFIINWFPKNTGLVGLMLAAILAAAMSTLSSSLNSSASALINDFYLPQSEQPVTPPQLLLLTRRFALGFGVLQIAIGILATTLERSVVSNALTIAGYSAGLLLGLFALGVLTRRVGQSAALCGAAVGLSLLLFVQFILPAVIPTDSAQVPFRIAWPWYALLGSSSTFVSGIVASKFLPNVSIDGTKKSLETSPAKLHDSNHERSHETDT